MTGVHLRLRAPLAARLDISGLTRSGVWPAAAEAERLRVPYGSFEVVLGDLFEVGSGQDGRLVIEGDARLDGVASGLAAGSVVIEGPVGFNAGAGMKGGTVEVRGDVAAFLGAGMSGGRIEVSGSAGDHAGAAPAGQRSGMSGGTIIVRKDAGARAGERMRAGLLAVAGSVGSHAAARMVAGTLIIGGRIGAGLGHAMRRGTILCRSLPQTALGFVDSGEHDLLFLDFLRVNLPELSLVAGGSRRARRLVGDLNAGGKGEVLILL